MIRRLATVHTVAEVANAPARDVIRVVEAFGGPGRSFLAANPGDPISPASTLDISHESLMCEWATFRNWLNEEQHSVTMFNRLVDQSRRWDTDNRGRDRLWTGVNLREATRWHAEAKPTVAWSRRYGGGLELATEFIKASTHEDARQRRRKHVAAFAGCYWCDCHFLHHCLGSYQYFDSQRATDIREYRTDSSEH